MRSSRLNSCALLFAWACTGTIATGPGASDDGSGSNAGTGGAGGSGGVGGVAQPPARDCAPLPRRLWKLTAEQQVHTMATFLPGVDRAAALAELEPTLASDDGNDASRLLLSEPHFAALMKVADTAARRALERPGELVPCLAGATPDESCVKSFVAGIGAKAFRRPLTLEEAASYETLFRTERAASTDAFAIEQVLKAMLMSPSFLFRSELGEAPASGARTVRLAPHEAASALSYALLDAPPDTELMASAMAGRLVARDERERQVRRLLAREGGAAGLARFFRFHLQSTHVLASPPRDTKLFPEFGPALAADMVEETRRFIADVLAGDRPTLTTLLVADHSFVNGRLGQVYGVEVSGAEFRKVTLPSAQRAGVLTQGSFLAAFALPDGTDIVKRGKFVRERLLCQPVPPPPPTVNAVPPRPDGMLTGRERLARHSADPTCAACHADLDPPGLAFEQYDAIGRFRTTEAGKTIDPSGELGGLDTSLPVRFDDARGMARALAALPEAQSCFLRELEGFLLGEHGDRTACRAEALEDAFARSGGDMVKAVIDVVTADDYFVRAVE